jgi:hypothetical protein
MEHDMTHRTLTMALPLALMVVACKKDDGPDPVQAARTFQGNVDQDDPALHSTSDLSVTTEARLTSYDAAGQTTDHGKVAVDAQGAFEVGLEETDDRYLLIESLDVSGTAVGGAMVDLRDAEDGDDVAIDGDTSVQAMVWARIIDEEGDARQDGVWIWSHLTAEVRTELHAYDDAVDDAASTNVALQAMAEAAVTARATRDEYAASVGVDLSADAWADLSTEALAGSSATSFVADLDTSLAAEGMTAVDRERLYTLVETSFRATLVTVFEVETSGARDFSGMLDAAVNTSAWLEAEGAGSAIGDNDTSGSDAFIVDLIADLDLALDAVSDDLISGLLPGPVAIDFHLDSDVAMELAVTGLIDQLGVDDRAALLIALGLGVGLTTDLVATAVYDEAVVATEAYQASLSASATAAVESAGSFDGEGYVSAQMTAWANLEGDLTTLSEEVDGGDDPLFAQAMVSSSSHFTFLAE